MPAIRKLFVVPGVLGLLLFLTPAPPASADCELPPIGSGGDAPQSNIVEECTNYVIGILNNVLPDECELPPMGADSPSTSIECVNYALDQIPDPPPPPSDVCSIPAYCDDLVGGEVDYWGLLEIADHGDCETAAIEPYRSGREVHALVLMSCGRTHAFTSIKGCIQIKKAGVWHDMSPCSFDWKEHSSYVDTSVDVACPDGRHRYRSRGYGQGINADGDVVHEDWDRSPGRAITCQALLP